MTRERPDLFEIVKRDREIAAIRERLARLESEKSELEARLDRLLSAQEAMDGSPGAANSAVNPARFLGHLMSLPSKGNGVLVEFS